MNELVLSGNYIGVVGARYLYEGRNSFPKLISLELDYNPLTSKGVEYISQAFSSLTMLSLDETKLSNLEQGSDEECAEFPISALNWRPKLFAKLTNAVCFICDNMAHKLEVLVLNKNDIGDDGAKSIGACKAFTNLKTLSLSFNKIGDDGFKSILSNEVLCINLTTLDLSSNRITKDSLGNIFMPALKRLNLCGNADIGEEGARLLVDADCANLEHLDLTSCSIYEERKLFDGKPYETKFVDWPTEAQPML